MTRRSAAVRAVMGRYLPGAWSAMASARMPASHRITVVSVGAIGRTVAPSAER